MQFDQPSLFLEGKSMYNTMTLLNAYIAYAKDVAIALGADPDVAFKDMQEMVKFEREIAKVCGAINIYVFSRVFKMKTGP